MTTYKELTGVLIKRQTTNPDDPLDGQVWYNNTTGNLNALAISEGWSSGGPLSTGRYLSGSLGTQTAGVQIAGSTPTNVSNVEHYNGTGWSEEANYPAAGQAMSGAGTQTAGVAFGGSTPSQTANAFFYDGTAWTAANPLPYAANNIASCGLAKTDVIGAVGRDGSSGNSGTNKSVTFDGTNFANGPNINTTRMFNNSSGAGTGTAGLIVGGFIDPSPNAMTNCEEYDGSSWTTTGSLNVATGFASAFGIQTNAVAQTNGSNYVETEAYNGSTWSTLPNMSVSSPGGLYGSSAGSTGDAGWVSSMGPAYNATEEFNRSTNVITAAAWASGGNLNTARSSHAMATNSPADTGLCFGGNYPSGTDNSEEYNGSTWSEGSNLPQALSFLGGAGTQTAGLSFTGRQNPGSRVNNTYEYNGTSWTESPGTYGAVQAYTGGAGTQTAALGVAGETPPGTDLTTSYEYNGSIWTAGNACNVAGYDALVFGTSAGAHMACLTGPPTGLETESYDGNNWTASATALQTQSQGGASGTYPVGLIFGGSSSGPSTSTQGWDGTAWSTRPALSTGRRAKGSGVTALGLAAGGETPASPTSNATEEFTPETSAVNIGKFTTS